MSYRSRIAAAVAALVTALLVAPGVAAAAQAGDETDQRFALTMTPNKQEQLSPGDEVAYTIEVANLGGEVDDARIVHMLPAGFAHVESNPDGESLGAQYVWGISLEAGETVTIEHTVKAGDAEQIDGGRLVQVEQPDLPEAVDGVEQFSSTVCIHDGEHREAELCASAWQGLERETAETADSTAATWIWVGGAVAAAAIAGFAFLWLRRRRARAR